MQLLHKESGDLQEAIIELVEGSDWELIEENSSFRFLWLQERQHIVYKIRLAIEEEILGLISLEDIPREFRIHVRLIEVNTHDIGQQKRFDHIAGCLFAFSCRLAFQKGYEGYVSLQPKTDLIRHYKEKYGFQAFGRNLFIELDNAQALINKYLNNAESR